jgi:hypothetical protein
MGTESLSVEQIAAAQAAQITELQAQLAALHERLGPDPNAKPVEVEGFPRIVYKLQEEPNPKQLDHPGWDAKRVASQKALDKALSDGWTDKIGDYVYTEPDEQIAVVKRGTRVKK